MASAVRKDKGRVDRLSAELGLEKHVERYDTDGIANHYTWGIWVSYIHRTDASSRFDRLVSLISNKTDQIQVPGSGYKNLMASKNAFLIFLGVF